MNVAANVRAKARNTRDEISEAVDEAGSRASRELGVLEQKASDVKDAAMEEISTMLTALNEKVKAMGIDAEALAESARDKAVSVEKSISRELVERPIRSLAIATLIGVALGVFTRK